MRLDFNKRNSLKDNNVVFHKKNCMTTPRLTIGMPTYRRAHTIRRALSSLAKQTSRDFVLVISDNASGDPETLKVIQEFGSDIPELVLVAQPENIGALPNLVFLLGVAETEYFMWLADDDEITPNYVAELIALLSADPTVVTAMGRWVAMQSPEQGVVMHQCRPDSRSRLVRLLRFIGGRADDSAFYGVHRTSSLRHCSFNDYWPPNRGVLTNWCYVLLFDLLLQGRFAYSDEASWISHNYSEKHYDRALALGTGDKVKTLLRRINLYAIYIGKSARSSPFFAPFIVGASVVGLVSDVMGAIVRLISAPHFGQQPKAK